LSSLLAPAASTLVDVLASRAEDQADEIAYTFLADGEGGELNLTYDELDRRARLIAGQLHELGIARALLVYPAGLDFISAFFGCLYAGVTAVPAYPPRLHRASPRIDSIAADARATAALTTSQLLARLERVIQESSALARLEWLASDTLEGGPCRPPLARVSGDTPALLQYTSGSTGSPKGVMVTHDNLIRNWQAVHEEFALTDSSVIVSWLPAFHDMGLGVILGSLMSGVRLVLMPPAAFIQRPVRWLQAISRYRGSFSAAPNFAYDLCAQKIAPEQKQDLDLSSWEVALNGSEPVRPATMDRFVAAFEGCGFRRSTFFPAYGLAEATLYVTGGPRWSEPVVVAVRASALERGIVEPSTDATDGARLLVGCGAGIPGQRMAIVDPETHLELAPNRIGEVWVSGPSIAAGYWERPNETVEVFQARTADTGDGPFLRTGDLGFIHNDQLFITGRLKDLIIIHGRNHYPQDIEVTVAECHPSIPPYSSAAFSINGVEGEALVVVSEVDTRRDPDLKEVLSAIRRAVTLEHELPVHGIALIQRGSIPKTSSGKIERAECRARFLAGQLELVEQSLLPAASAATAR